MDRDYFGTDGIRGRVGEKPITPDFCVHLGWAVGKVLTSSGSPMVVIGKDTRISGYMIESALEAGLASAGVDVNLFGPIPTPAVAYLTRTLRADAGIVISASHNPFDDNGIKFFDADGKQAARRDGGRHRGAASPGRGFGRVPGARSCLPRGRCPRSLHRILQEHHRPGIAPCAA